MTASLQAGRLLARTMPGAAASRREWLRWGVSVLADAGITNAEHEAVWIMEHVLGISRLLLHLEAGHLVGDQDAQRLVAVFGRRADREPLQYLLGSQEFCGLELSVSPAVLIPRPETEILVDAVVGHCGVSDDPVIIDVGTGSGCIAVAVAKRLPRARVFAVDLSKDALAVAHANAVRHQVQERITFLEGDLFSPIRSVLHGKVDVIVSNPPYVKGSDWKSLEPEVAVYEPRLALDGGSDGLSVYRRLLHEAWVWLVPGGYLMLEVGHGQSEEVRVLAQSSNRYRHIETRKDAAGIERVLCFETQRDRR